ncbi:MAG: hypothetical protein ABFQ62_05445 [Patescibacteria group bacterium]
MKKYPKIKKSTSLKLEDAAIALEYGTLNNDRRVQLKIPGFILDKFDKLFSHETRSKAITRLMLQAVSNTKAKTTVKTKKKARSDFDKLLAIGKKYTPKDAPTNLSTNYKQYLYGDKSVKFGKFFK